MTLPDPSTSAIPAGRSRSVLLPEQRDQVRQLWNLLAVPEGVLELRAPKCGPYKKTLSGYFTEGDALVAAVSEWNGKAPGLYLTLNPANPALLARSANRVQLGAETTTQDADIVRRRWLPVDFDAQRPAGISSTDAEHEAALHRAQECRLLLQEAQGIGSVLADSGNGAHLLLPIDLPNDPDALALVKGVLTALASRFDDTLIKIDRSVFNAARIFKCYGTLSGKGDNTPERPHRYARLLDVPAHLPPIPVKTLRALAGTDAPKTTPTPQGRARHIEPTSELLDVPAFLQQHGLLVQREKDWQEWHQWILEACPFNPEHTAPDAMISQNSAGALTFKCLHNSCSVYDWKALRERLEPSASRRQNLRTAAAKPSGRATEVSQQVTAAKMSLPPTSLAETTLEEEAAAAAELPYEETPYGLVWKRVTRDGPLRTPLTNFTARILADILEDDGAETSLRYCIQAQRKDKTTSFTIPASAFDNFGWVSEHLGIGAACYPGALMKEHAQFAIRQLSERAGATRETAYTHTGWREVAPGVWGYLHGGGVIGTDVPPGIQVHLDESRARYVLPPPPQGEALHQAIAATLRLSHLGPPSLLFPLLAAIFRAAIRTAEFSLSLSGPSGAFKSELASLAQRHFGAAMDANHLPGSWSSTDNSLEELAFRIKDALLVLDDFAPSGGINEIARLHAKADRVLRAQGNGSGRQRMRRDGSLPAPRPPRGLILSTGEDIPQGKSLRARQFILEVGPTDIRADRLSACQKDAGEGLYAQCMAGFLAWLSPGYARLRETYCEQVEQLRDRVYQESGKDAHRRTPEIVADLCLGLSSFLQFAQETGALSVEDMEAWYARGKQAILVAAQAQALHQQGNDPALRFLDLVRSALSSGAAHVADMEGLRPDNASAWGWRYEVVGLAAQEQGRWEPKGERIGWTEGEDLYLEKDAAFKVARRQGGEGEGMALTSTVLYKRLLEGGHLRSTERHSSRGTLHIRKKAEKKLQNVLHLSAADMLSEKAESGDTTATSEEV